MITEIEIIRKIGIMGIMIGEIGIIGKIGMMEGIGNV